MLLPGGSWPLDLDDAVSNYKLNQFAIAAQFQFPYDIRGLRAHCFHADAER